MGKTETASASATLRLDKQHIKVATTISRGRERGGRRGRQRERSRYREGVKESGEERGRERGRVVGATAAAESFLPDKLTRTVDRKECRRWSEMVERERERERGSQESEGREGGEKHHSRDSFLAVRKQMKHELQSEV